MNDPQAADPHFAVRITPPGLGSFRTLTLNCSVPFTVTDAGMELASETVTGSETIV